MTMQISVTGVHPVRQFHKRYHTKPYIGDSKHMLLLRSGAGYPHRKVSAVRYRSFKVNIQLRPRFCSSEEPGAFLFGYLQSAAFRSCFKKGGACAPPWNKKDANSEQVRKLLCHQPFSRATATSLTFVPVGPVMISPPVFSSAW